MTRTNGLVALLTLLAMAPAAGAQTPAPQSLRLYVFDGGSLNIPDTAPYRLKKEEIATNYMSVVSFLIVHPKGTLMWDTGAVPDSAFPPGGGPGTLRYASSAKPLRAQLASAGYKPSDITYLALSTFTGTTSVTPISSPLRHGWCRRPNATSCFPLRRRRAPNRRITVR